jgi:hypothetical protein
MRKLTTVGLLALIAFGSIVMISSVRSLAAECPEGKITCFEWCRKYNSSSRTCLAGHPGSCDKKVGGNAACVNDKPNSPIAPTCSANNAECNAFCATPDGRAQGQACPNACNERMQNCLRTGTYFWRNRPTATGLERK